MKFNLPRPRVSTQTAEPVNRVPGLGFRKPGTRVVAPTPVEEDDDFPAHMQHSMLPDPKPVRRRFQDWKAKP